MTKLKEMKGKKCERPDCKGRYAETDLYCDWGGVVKCNICRHTVPSRVPEKSSPTS